MNAGRAVVRRRRRPRRSCRPSCQWRRWHAVRCTTQPAGAAPAPAPTRPTLAGPNRRRCPNCRSSWRRSTGWRCTSTPCCSRTTARCRWPACRAASNRRSDRSTSARSAACRSSTSSRASRASASSRWPATSVSSGPARTNSPKTTVRAALCLPFRRDSHRLTASDGPAEPLQSLNPSLLPQMTLLCRELVDLLKMAPQCRIPFSKFIPAYHHRNDTHRPAHRPPLLSLSSLTNCTEISVGFGRRFRAPVQGGRLRLHAPHRPPGGLVARRPGTSMPSIASSRRASGSLMFSRRFWAKATDAT